MLRFIKKHGRVISKAAMLVAVVIVVCLCTAGTASATQATTAAQETATAAGSNNNNLINFSVAAGDGSDMASVLQMLLVLTIISLGTINIDAAYVIYENRYSSSLYKSCVRCADDSA